MSNILSCRQISTALSQIKAQKALFDHAFTEGDYNQAIKISNEIEDLLKPFKITSPEEAREIFESDFYGAEAIKRAFDIEIPPEKIPPVPFPKEELLLAKKLGQTLILQLNQPKTAPL